MKSRLLLACLSLFLTSVALFAASVEETVNGLIPKLGAERISERYEPQMSLLRLAANAARPGAEAERIELAKIFATKASDPAVPQPARVWIVRQLEHIGGAESVGALTGLLKGQDTELRDCVRRALEQNPAPGAGASLRAALKEGGEPSWRIGLIHSLGERRDREAVVLIAPGLNDSALVPAASLALGKIASAAAVKGLWAAFERKVPSAADSLVVAANQLAANRSARAANAIYSRLYRSAGGTTTRAAALSGLAKTRASETKRLISEALASPDAKLQAAAVGAAQTFHGSNASRELAALLPRLGSAAKIFVLQTVDSTAETQVCELAADQDQAVQSAALQTLGRIGGERSVPVLAMAATSGNPETAKTAAASLARLSGMGVDSALIGLARAADAKTRVVAIRALTARKSKTALPEMLSYAAESDAAISAAACEALGQMGTESEFVGLADLVLAGQTPGAAAALQDVAVRLSDKESAAKKLVATAKSARAEQIVPLIGVFSVLGGQEAFTAISGYASSSNEELSDAARRALCDWPDFRATKPLLAIAADANTSRVHNVLAVQGIVRLVKASESEPAEARLEAVLGAMNAARRDEDKKLALSALGTVHSAKAAETIQPWLKEPDFKSEAGMAGVEMAAELVKTDPASAKALAKAIADAKISEDLTKRAQSIWQP